MVLSLSRSPRALWGCSHACGGQINDASLGPRWAGSGPAWAGGLPVGFMQPLLPGKAGPLLARPRLSPAGVAAPCTCRAPSPPPAHPGPVILLSQSHGRSPCNHPVTSSFPVKCDHTRCRESIIHRTWVCPPSPVTVQAAGGKPVLRRAPTGRRLAQAARSTPGHPEGGPPSAGTGSGPKARTSIWSRS